MIIMSKFIIILSKDMNRIKKYETGIVGSFLLSLLLLFSSCQNTGLMYDVSQPGTVYFVKKASADAPVCSFVFEVEDEITYEVPVKLMGMPCNYDREFVVTLKQDTMTTIKAGGVSAFTCNSREKASSSSCVGFAPNSRSLDLRCVK